MAQTFIEISFILGIVFIFSFLMRILRQPLIVGYILSGVVLGPYFLDLLPKTEILSVFSELGIAFLLFAVGLHLSPKVIKEVGRISLITGLGQIFFTALFGYLLAKILGFSNITSLYIAIALTFSSTIIIMKILADKNDLESLYGRISIGFLLVQDLIAILTIIVISSFSNSSGFFGPIILTLVKGSLLVLILIPISLFILPKLQGFFARSQEFLFVFALSWGLVISSLFLYLGLSIEVGALIAGVLLSISPYNLEVSSRLKPLRDFFLISFFLVLGAQMAVTNVSHLIFPAIIFSLLILIGNPLIVISLMGFEGFTKKTSFLSGLTVAQIGEFSLITIALGVKLGHISNEILSLITLISLITIGICTYMMLYSNSIYKVLSSKLYLFERKNLREKRKLTQKIDAILFGYNRIGFDVLTSLKKIKKRYLVVDFNPDVIYNLKKLRVPSLYGDADDENLLDELPLQEVKLIISTIPDFETNELILTKVKKINQKSIVILRAHTIDEAMKLYDKGADYVVTPHFLGGEYLGKMIYENKTNSEEYSKERKKHIENLKERLFLGHKHPEVEKN
ncbi:MAG: potassium transporter Kef [Candidatus Pacearchaeota archaeon]|nr:MAG: potassium transporter Kef [Candidatus Pacearchaeota archaeon]